MAGGEHVEDRDRALGGELLEQRVGPGAHADRRRRGARGRARCPGPTRRARAASRRGAGSSGGRPARRCRPRTTAACASRASGRPARRSGRAARREERGAAFSSAARASSASSSSALSSAPVRKWRGKAREDTARCCVLTWNLFHGRAVARRAARAAAPTSPRGSPAGSGTSRCCRRCRRGGRPRSGARAGPSARTALTSRNWLLPAPRWAAERAPRPHQVLGRRRQRDPRARRGDRASTAVRTLRALARAARGARRAPRARLVGRATCTPRRTPRRARRPTSTCAARTAIAWSAGAPVVLGRRPQPARARWSPASTHAAGQRRRPRLRATATRGRAGAYARSRPALGPRSRSLAELG